MPLPGAAGQLESRILTLERRVLALEAIGLVMLPTPALHTLWDGGGDSAKTSANNGVLDLSVLFGLPAGISAIFATLGAYSATVGKAVWLGPSATYSWVTQVVTPASGFDIRAAFCPCDGNGDVYFSMDTGATAQIILRIYGYMR